MNENPYLKYENKDNCSYPFTPDPSGYCWAYASYIDKAKGFEKLDCSKCEFLNNPTEKESE